MHNMTRVGVDWAKMVIQVQAVDVAGKVVINRCIQRASFLAWCSGLPAGCLVAMEACTGAHHWCRPLIKLGLDARMMPVQLVAPHRIQGKTGKDDANDAAAACEAASRAHMHFVPPKTLDQQGMLCVHRLREALKQERIAAHRKDSEQVQRAAEPRGIGVITASAAVATVGDFTQFKNGAQFGAWLGLTPRHNSSGGKTSLGASPSVATTTGVPCSCRLPRLLC